MRYLVQCVYRRAWSPCVSKADDRAKGTMHVCPVSIVNFHTGMYELVYVAMLRWSSTISLGWTSKAKGHARYDFPRCKITGYFRKLWMPPNVFWTGR